MQDELLEQMLADEIEGDEDDDGREGRHNWLSLLKSKFFFAKFETKIWIVPSY